jgi:hypothetical protein
MTDLSSLVGKNIPRLLIVSLVRSDSSGPDAYYLNALVLMTDRAAYSYEQARTALGHVAANHKPGEIPLLSLLRGTDYLEFAVNAILRASLLGERLRRSPDAPRIDRNELLSRSELEQVRKLRHFAEHLDQRILEGRIGPTAGSGVVFRAMADCIEYAGETVTYAAIGEWITRLDALAWRLLD